MGHELVNALNMDVAQRGKANEQHQNVAKPVVQRNPTMFTSIHQTTP
jgi:hypothetical protein